MIRWATVAFLLLTSSPVSAACAPDRVTVYGAWGQARFNVDVADDPAERSRGLMFVEEMGTLEGMLFVYERPQRTTFWMRNTLIPLDMVFVSPEGEVLKIHENAIPLDETTIDGGDGVKYVLEINGGLSARLGITVGDVLAHPSIGPDAIRPCAN